MYTIPVAAAVLPSLSVLSFRGLPEMFLDGQVFLLEQDLVTKNRARSDSGGEILPIKSLAIRDCKLGALRAGR